MTASRRSLTVQNRLIGPEGLSKPRCFTLSERKSVMSPLNVHISAFPRGNAETSPFPCPVSLFWGQLTGLEALFGRKEHKSVNNRPRGRSCPPEQAHRARVMAKTAKWAEKGGKRRKGAK